MRLTKASQRGTRAGPCGGKFHPPPGHRPRNGSPLAGKQHGAGIIAERLYHGDLRRQDPFDHLST
jgi:hypothetical protein